MRQRIFHVHHPDLVAQAAGYLDREDYAPNLGLDPDEIDEFKDMSNLLWAWLPSQVEQLRQVSIDLCTFATLCSASSSTIATSECTLCSRI